MTRASTEYGVTETFTGKFVNAFDLRPDDICIEDIAHHLAMECRFAGACNRRYSVAEHSIIARRCAKVAYAASPSEQLATLMHDAFEPYGKDLPSPHKTKEYRLAEDNGMKVISTALDFDYPSSLAKVADDVMIWLEVNVLMKSGGRGWQGYEERGRDIIETYKRATWAEHIVTGPGQEHIMEAVFLRDYHELIAEVQAERALAGAGRTP